MIFPSKTTHNFSVNFCPFGYTNSLNFKERNEKYWKVFDIIFVLILLKTFELTNAVLTKLKYKCVL